MSETPIERPGTGKLAAALAAFQAEMPTVAKKHTAQVKSDKGSYSYTYAGLADVTEAAMPLLAKNGLAFTALPNGQSLVGMLLHESGESLTAALPINGSTPQQIGSSLTYMRRYLFGCMTGLVTDDDDDGHLAQNAPKARKAAAASKPAAEPLADKPLTAPTRGRLFAMFTEHGIEDRDEQIRGIAHIIKRGIQSRSEITEGEALAVIGVLKSRPRSAAEPPQEES